MDLHISMDMSQEELMDIISQLDSALILPSPITPPSQQLLPSDPFYVTAPCASPQMPVRPPATTMEHAGTREMIYRAAVMRPVCVDMEEEAAAARPRRRNVRISSEPQSVAARLRRERVSQRMRVLQRLVPGGTRMDTASMLDEAIRYVKFLKSHVQSLEQAAAVAGMHGSRHGGVLAGEEFYSCPYFV